MSRSRKYSVPKQKYIADKRNREGTRSIVKDRIRESLERKNPALDLSGLGIESLPTDIARLIHLEKLDLSDNRLADLPASIGQLTGLRRLDLSNNRLAEVPESIGRLAELQRLYLGYNRLAEVPESIGRLTELQNLYLAGNRLAKVPESVGRLAGLQRLSLGGNRLTEVPEWIGRLAELQVLILHDNQLTEVPESVGQLAGLQELILWNNQLAALPGSIGRLAGLRVLDVTNNQLAGLPEELRRLERLEALYLHDNPAVAGLPAEVLGPTWQQVLHEKKTPAKPDQILDYYFRTRGPVRPLNEAKLILVGRGLVGKTCLVNRLVHDTFEPQPMTEGIRITQWPVQLHGDEEVRLHVWDFGGQEIMHATHQFFLTERSLYLLVLSGREGTGDLDAEYWLRMIESFGAESPVIVVLNKIQEKPFDVNRRALQSKYPGIREFLRTDCKDRTGLDDLHAAIRREIDRLEDRRVKFPAAWFAIKEGLSGTGKNYLTYEEYRKFCLEQGETEPDEQDKLAGFLHVLGIALNYREDPRLRYHHVLNPHWVTAGVYALINARQLATQKGVLHFDDIARIIDSAAAAGSLKREDYPRSMHGFLLDLMRKFELCFPFPGDDSRYLVPELLDNQEPAEAAEFDPAGCLNFQYHYPVVPKGLLPRFIVRTHVLSEGQPRWRTGVILQFEGNLALVKADSAEKQVAISVRGPSPDSRRRLLAVIRSDFDHIHRDLKRKPQEMVPVPKHPDVVVPYENLRAFEEKRISDLPAVAGTDVVILKVQELLNGVDFPAARARRPGPGRIGTEPEAEGMTPLSLFYSYSHKDEDLRNQLETHLKLMQRQEVITAWHDRLIGAGEEWKHEIDENLERADLILLLVSSDFIASDYCYDEEMTRALQRHDAGKARVIPVIVRDVNWSKAPFAKLQALPKDGKAVTLWPDRDCAWRNVAEGIERAAEELRKARR